VSNETRAASRRKIPGVVLAAFGVSAAIAYGIAGAKLSFGPPLVMVGLGGLTVVLVGVALFRVLDPLLRTEVERIEPEKGTAHQRELERDKQMVLKAIREIEHDYQMRKIAESDYQDLLQRYRGRAMRIIRELDAGDNYRTLIEDELKARLSVMTAAPACPSCGTANDGDAQFCKKCGGKLKEAAS
jgi:hypothetical protein